MKKNTLRHLFLFCFALCTVGTLFAQPVVFTGTLPETEINADCDGIPAPATLTAEGCMGVVPFVFLNEIHYDNDGGDAGEFIEVVGSAGFDLSNCSIELYNGNGGAIYNTIDLSGTIDDEGFGFGAVSFPISGIQNGSPDGFALVCNGVVEEFLSYEGSFTATSGTADGTASTDIGVSEPGTTPIGQSLQRVNLFIDNPGCSTLDLQWTGPAVASPGTINTGESFQAADCAQATDAIVSLAESTVAGNCPGNFTLTRLWTATDACGSTAQYTQTLTVIDTVGPVFYNPPADLALNCGDAIPPIQDVVAFDNCSGDVPPMAFINEIHYDNASTDVGEFVEIAGTAGFDLTGCELVTYNGANSQTYGTPVALSGIIPNEGMGFGAFAFPYAPNGLQNGAPDGIAFVCNGVVVQFISYEGTLTAVGGPADGMTSTDIGVQEPGAIGESLQLVGVGVSGSDFTWTGPVAESPGMINVDQIFGTIMATYVETNNFDLCGDILRTYTATDLCGNSSVYTQTISISDDEDPVLTCPPSQTLSCFESIPAPATSAAEFIAAGGTIADNCTTDLNDFIVFAQNSSNGGDNCPGNGTLVTRTYFVEDACGNMSTCTQTFTYLESTQVPVITSILPTCYKYCASMANPMESDITFDTDCSFGASVNITGPTQIGQDNCPGSIYRYTYTVTDDCGRTSAPVTRDFVIGNDGPTIEAPDFNLFLECNDPNNQDYIDAHIGLVTANTSCALGYNISYSPQSFNLNACGSATVVTFVVTDDCGRTATASTTIAVQDNTPPTITSIPPSICDEAECGGDVNYWYTHWIDYMETGITAEDNCDTNVSIGSVNTPLNTTCDASGNAVTLVTFTATDNCGNTATYVGTFTIVNEGPANFINVPDDATVACGDPIVFGPAPTAVNGCDVTVTMATVVDDSNPCSVLHTRTWTATDQCGGLTATASQTITEEDTVDPVISGGADLTVECTEDLLTAAQAWASTNAGATATDACTSVSWTNNLASAQVETTPDCTGGVLAYVDVTFTATDVCGNSSSVTYRANLTDNTAPIFTSIPTGGTVECANDAIIADAEAEDACGAVTITMNDDVTGDDCSGSITRTWTATDACGNTATASATFNYIDTQAPTATNVPADMTISCSEQVVFGAAPTWSDNCDTDIFSSFEDFTTPGDCANNYSIRRDWAAIDECGNLEVVSQTITVEDNEVPIFTSIPAGGNMDCGTPMFGDAEASDNCTTDVTITFEDEISGSGCTGGVTRTWTATDECGNVATASATATVNDDEAPVFTSVPTGGTVDCGTLSFGDAEATDNCATNVSITFDDVTTGSGCVGSTTRTWTATDDCGNTATASATITLDDGEAPVFTSVPAGGTVECEADANFDDAEATDNCNVTVTFEDDVVTGCNGSITRTWTATDECGNTTTASATISYNDDEAPVFTFVPDVADLDCDDDLTPVMPQASDNCGAVTIELTDEDINGALCDDGYAINYTWTATDACGNTATVETQIWIDPDNEGPEFTYVPPGDYGDCDNFPPDFGEPEVEDACGSVTLTFIDEAIGNPDGCDDGENFDYRRVWTATDACGNTSTAKQTFWILVEGPANSSVSGLIATELDDAVENVEVNMTGGGNFNETYITSDDGIYSFNNLTLESNYAVNPYSNDAPMNGVSTYDLVLISKHVLEIEMLDSPYKMIAADVNKSGSITTFDMVELRKMILFINTEFPNNDSWRFVDANFVFPYAENPFATVFPEVVNINGLLASEVHDFVAVKIGDVNGTVVANNLMGADDRTFNGDLNFELDNQNLKAGSTYDVTFRASDFNEVAGYQYSIAFDNSQLEFVTVEAGELEGLAKGNFGLNKLNEGIITTSWNSNEAVSMRDAAELFTITFKATSNAQLSDLIRVSSRYTQAEAYNADLDLMNVAFRFEGATVATEFSLQQNQPNPFKQSTVIGFSLPADANANLTFYDVSGKVLKQINGDFVKGYNEVNLNRNELQANGVVYYELVTPTHTATKRMLLTNN